MSKQKKRLSKRRWKARCVKGRIIPMMAIVEHRLDRWFEFNGLPWNDYYYVARRRNEAPRAI